MEEETNNLGKYPLIGGHLPFGDMGITPPPTNSVMDVCNVTFDQLKQRVVQQRNRYFLKDPQNPVSFSREKVINGNSKRNLRAFIVVNVAFTTGA